MRAGDVPALQDIERRAGSMFLDVGMPDIAGDDPPTADELLRAPAVLVAVDDDDVPLGYAWVELVGGLPHLEQLSVPPDHGGRGIGTALLDAAAAWARDQGAESITLTTFRDVPFNAPFYAARGFDVVPQAEWSEAIAALVAEEAEHGLDPSIRVVMRRAV